MRARVKLRGIYHVCSRLGPEHTAAHLSTIVCTETQTASRREGWNAKRMDGWMGQQDHSLFVMVKACSLEALLGSVLQS
jgi:hypothetical protein